MGLLQFRPVENIWSIQKCKNMTEEELNHGVAEMKKEWGPVLLY